MKRELNRTLFLFKNYVEHVPRKDIEGMVPGVARGIYVLFQEGDDERMNVVYIGRSTGSNKQGVGGAITFSQ
jgi:hypothetical protein